MAEMKILTLAGLEHFAQKVDAQLETKVNIEQGKALSTNDYSNEEKQKVATLVTKVEGLETTGGMPNVIETVKVNDVALVPDSAKAVNIDLSSYALKSDLVSAMYWKGSVATYDALPTEGVEAGYIYHIEATGAEWAWNGTEWVELGSIVDLSAYAKTADVNSAISTAVAPLAKTEDVNTELAKKADKTTVDATVEEINAALATKAVASEVTSALNLKANSADVYTKTAADELLAVKATKTEVTEGLAGKANVTDVYTKTDIDGKVTTINEAIALKANASDVTASLALKADASTVYTKTEADNLLNAKVNVADLTAISTAEIDAFFA